MVRRAAPHRLVSMELKLAVFTVQMLDLTPEQAAAELQRLGYDGVEWRVTDLPAEIPANRNYWNGNVCAIPIDDIVAQVPRVRALSAQHNLGLPSLGTYLSHDQTARIEACLEAAKQLGVPMLRVSPPGWKKDVPYSDWLAGAIRSWEPVVALGRRAGVKILLELHHNSPLCTASAAMRFLEGFNPDETGVIYDPGNMIHEGWEHPDTAISVLGPYLAHVHIKNARWLETGQVQHGTAKWQGEMCRLTVGQVVWPQVFASLKKWGYDGWFSTEDFGPGETVEKLAENIAVLREWAASW